MDSLDRDNKAILRHTLEWAHQVVTKTNGDGEKRDTRLTLGTAEGLGDASPAPPISPVADLS